MKRGLADLAEELRIKNSTVEDSPSETRTGRLGDNNDLLNTTVIRQSECNEDWQTWL